MSTQSMSQDAKAIKSNEIKAESDKSIEKTLEFCMTHKFFSDMFDRTMNQPHDAEEDPVTQYCIRKHVVDNNEIDTKVYHVNVNPNNIDTKEAAETCRDFYKLYKMFTKLAFEAVIEKNIRSEATRECVRGVLFKTRVIDLALALEVLSELKLTDAQKAAEKKKFMSFVDEFTESMLKCV